MRQKPASRQSHGESVVKDVRRATRGRYLAEEKIRIVPDGLKGQDGTTGCAVAKGLRRASPAAGPGTLS